MQIAVLGTGIVGQTLATRLAGLDHQVTLGTRDPDATRARTEPDRFGTPPIRDFLAGHPGIGLAAFADAAAGAELVVNATHGEASEAALAAVGADQLAGTVVLDVSNPLDGSHGFPPSLWVKDTDSLAERLQRAFPRARVVKALNTMNCALMVDPGQLAGGDHSVLVSGDDADAKRTVSELLRSFGWRDVIDLGDLSTARGAEMYVALWLRLLPAVGGGGQFNIKVVR
jgi:8-hydroxy-5-deazaflavin:NADPH oxidoreductase